MIDPAEAVDPAARADDSASRSYVHTLDPARRRQVRDELADVLADHPDVAGRDELSYERPCTLHQCRCTAPR